VADVKSAAVRGIQTSAVAMVRGDLAKVRPSIVTFDPVSASKDEKAPNEELEEEMPPLVESHADLVDLVEGEKVSELPPKTEEEIHLEMLYWDDEKQEEYHNLKLDIERREWSAYRTYFFNIVEHKAFSATILTVILLNVLLVALSTISEVNMVMSYWLSLLDNFFLAVYVTELLWKVFVYRFRYFRSGWNIFDFAIVLLSFMDWLRFISSYASVYVSYSTGSSSVFRVLRVLRALRAVRALRALRTINFFRGLQLIIDALIQSVPAMTSVILIVTLIMYIYAVVGIFLYGEIYPERFGHIWLALWTNFQLLTMDDWFGIYVDIREDDQYMIFYLISYIVIESFILINFFVAIIANNLQYQTSKDEALIRAELEKYNFVRRPKQSMEDGLGIVVAPDGSKFKLLEKTKTKSNVLADYYPPEHFDYDPRTRRLMGYYFMLLGSGDDSYVSQDRLRGLLDDLTELLDRREIFDTVSGDHFDQALHLDQS
jgi:hypothetical protein